MILLRREWLGVALALLFVLVAQFAIVGTWIVPRDLPAGWALFAWIITGLVWLVAQWLTWRRARVVTSPVLSKELMQLRAQAESAIERNEYSEARGILLAAATLNDEDAETHALWARMYQALGQPQPARRAWKRVLSLNSSDSLRGEARQALR